MGILAIKTNLNAILPIRKLFLEEIDFQIRYDSCHKRGWSDSYLLTLDDQKVGYGSVKGKDDLNDRDAVFEFYIIPSFRKYASSFFSELLKVSEVNFVEAQTNDKLLSSMLYEFSSDINSDTILFNDFITTTYEYQMVLFRLRKGDETMSGLELENMGGYILEQEGNIIATGGFLTHYNKPFADLYMDVIKNQRRKGLGSFILQEIKKECYKAGYIPAARCNIKNVASKATLLKAGFRVCGFMLIGKVN